MNYRYLNLGLRVYLNAYITEVSLVGNIMMLIKIPKTDSEIQVVVVGGGADVVVNIFAVPASNTLRLRS